ncbi:MAG: hypothetical protein MZV64_10125 [Ignavibacteriales bacterium]|nr:hypothetical protein [Ignavibacteriales bacterium]
MCASSQLAQPRGEPHPQRAQTGRLTTGSGCTVKKAKISVIHLLYVYVSGVISHEVQALYLRNGRKLDDTHTRLRANRLLLPRTSPPYSGGHGRALRLPYRTLGRRGPRRRTGLAR